MFLIFLTFCTLVGFLIGGVMGAVWGATIALGLCLVVYLLS